MPRNTLTLLGAVAVILSQAACATVPPFDREKLAHPTMSSAELANGLEGHVRAVSEGAAGGLSGAGGGCGCN